MDKRRVDIIGRTILCLMAWLFAYNACAEQNLALFALDEEAMPWVELALAELSDEPGIALLERTEMAKLQKELALAETGEDAIALLPGLMQNVELFAVVKNRSIQAFDGTTGVRLLDVPITSPDALTEAVRQAAQKQRSFKQETLHKLSCLPMTAANLSEEQSKRAYDFEELLLRWLANMPDVVLLERRHLILLLNEPNVERDKLTSQLFAGSLVIKPSISPTDDGGLRLRLEFYAPNGKVLLKRQEEVIKPNQELPSVVKTLMQGFSLPVFDQEDKAGEAQKFIKEAWFAVHQGIDDDALTAAASAGALDAEYKKELCRISAISAQRFLKRSYYFPKAKLRIGLVNLKTALDVAIRQRVFPVELQQAFQVLFRYSAMDFKRCFEQQEEEARSLTGRGIVTYMKFLQPPPGESPTMGIAERASLLERLSEYLFRTAYFVQVDWDVTYWEQFTLPVMQDFINRSNRLFTDYLGEDLGKLDLNESQKRFGGNGITFRTISVNLIRFYPREQSPEAQRVFERTFKMMASSRVLQYAIIGRFGLLKLELGETGIATALNRHKNIDAQLDAFYADLLRYMENGLLCNRVDTLPSLVQSCIMGDPKHIGQKIQLQEVALRRFKCPNLLGEHLFYGYEEWPQETAKMVYAKLQEWQKGTLSESDRQNYARYQNTLERRFKLKKEQSGVQPLIVDLAFKHARMPFKKQPYYWNLILLGNDRERVFLLGNRATDDDDDDTARIQLLELNPKSGRIKTLQEYKGEFGENCGQGLFGTMTDTDFIAVAGYMMYLLPRNLSKKLRVVDLSQYGKEECHSMVVAGNRVFLSFDGKFDHPGNLVEYDLNSQKSKCIASTIDRSIVWPMQGYEQPYAIGKLMPDLKNKRLLMLLHDKEKHPYKMQYIVRLWGFYWETGKWEVLSEYLPTFSQETSQLLDDNGRFWLASPHGVGPLNTKGIWQPLVVFNNKTRRIALEVFLGTMFEGHDKVPIDYSKRLLPNDTYPAFHDPTGFVMLSPKYAISDEYLLDLETMRFYRLPDKLVEPQLLAGKYLLFNTKDNSDFEDKVLVNLEACF